MAVKILLYLLSYINSKYLSCLFVFVIVHGFMKGSNFAETPPLLSVWLAYAVDSF